LGALRVHAEVEHVAFEEPAVGERTAVVLPEPRAPEGLSPRVLEASPREISHVLRPVRPAEGPALLDEPLHASQVVGAGVVGRYGAHGPGRSRWPWGRRRSRPSSHSDTPIRASMSTPVSIPSPSSRKTRSSVAMFPVALGA